MGHEVSGEIIDIGKGVTRFHSGERITSCLTEYCGKRLFNREPGLLKVVLEA